MTPIQNIQPFDQNNVLVPVDSLSALRAFSGTDALSRSKVEAILSVIQELDPGQQTEEVWRVLLLIFSSQRGFEDLLNRALEYAWERLSQSDITPQSLQYYYELLSLPPAQENALWCVFLGEYAKREKIQRKIACGWIDHMLECTSYEEAVVHSTVSLAMRHWEPEYGETRIAQLLDRLSSFLSISLLCDTLDELCSRGFDTKACHEIVVRELLKRSPTAAEHERYAGGLAKVMDCVPALQSQAFEMMMKVFSSPGPFSDNIYAHIAKACWQYDVCFQKEAFLRIIKAAQLSLTRDKNMPFQNCETLGRMNVLACKILPSATQQQAEEILRGLDAIFSSYPPYVFESTRTLLKVVSYFLEKGEPCPELWRNNVRKHLSGDVQELVVDWYCSIPVLLEESQRTPERWQLFEKQCDQLAFCDGLNEGATLAFQSKGFIQKQMKMLYDLNNDPKQVPHTIASYKKLFFAPTTLQDVPPEELPVFFSSLTKSVQLSAGPYVSTRVLWNPANDIPPHALRDYIAYLGAVVCAPKSSQAQIAIARMSELLHSGVIDAKTQSNYLSSLSHCLVSRFNSEMHHQ